MDPDANRKYQQKMSFEINQSSVDGDVAKDYGLQRVEDKNQENEKSILPKILDNKKAQIKENRSLVVKKKFNSGYIDTRFKPSTDAQTSP